MGSPVIAAPSSLEAWEVTIDDDTFVVFEWQVGALGGYEALTAAEREVLQGLLVGESNEEIGRRRGRSARTSANQVASIFRKLGVSSRSELIALVVCGGAAKPRTR